MTKERADTRSRDYIVSLGLLIELHALIAQGRGESPEADALRDSMDAPWREMVSQEQLALDALSADLWLLHDLKKEKRGW